MKRYNVDAFTNEPFSGNPAAVCVMDRWPSEAAMKKLAMENNLSETAFIVKEPEGYHLRWFTPTTEVELCGHATLASAYVILNHYEPESDCVSRSFCPKLGIPEDPVCGSAHCQIADYWAKELSRPEIHAYQASKRGGHLYCHMQDNGRIMISGEAALVAAAELIAELK